MESILRLFNGIQVDSRDHFHVPEEVHVRTIRHGYLVDGSFEPTDESLDLIDRVIGLSGSQVNASFHKSWEVVRDSDIEDLVIHQILHYITTYGFEHLGIYDRDLVYLPHEVLDVPERELPFVVVRGYTKEEILDKIISLGSGIALHQDTLNHIMEIVRYNDYPNFVDEINNKELSVLLMDYYNTYPTEPVEFLRFLVAKLTGQALLIKSHELIEAIKQSDGEVLDAWLDYAPDDLGSIFFRFKPLFLAMKSLSSNKTFFNRLRKQAAKLHTPLTPSYLDTVTNRVSRGLSLDNLEHHLSKANTFRKARLANALNFRLSNPTANLYRVRNGKSWVDEFEWDGDDYDTDVALDTILTSIASDLSCVESPVYIPDGVVYALPSSEKQFTGNFPSGSYVIIPDNDILLGIYWENVEGAVYPRVDLDFSLVGLSDKFGWDSQWRGDDTLFSGDITDATNGASEVFWLKQLTKPVLSMVNYFNFTNDVEVPTKLFIAWEQPDNFGKNYLVNPNNIIAQTDFNVTRKQSLLGVLMPSDQGTRFHFANLSVGNTITSRSNYITQQIISYYLSAFSSPIGLNGLLVDAGVEVVSQRTDDCIDLSPGSLAKDTIIGMLQG